MQRALFGAVFAAATSIAACGGQSLDFSPQTGVAVPLGTTLDACPTLDPSVTLTAGDGSVVMPSICIRDEVGNYYAAELSDTALPAPGFPVLPPGHSYSVVYRLDPAYLPKAAALANSGQTYAADDPLVDAQGSCWVFPEDHPSNLVPSTLSLEGDVLVLALTRSVPAGQQVVANLDVSALYAGTPACSAGGVCGGGFLLRFYVGALPASLVGSGTGGGGAVLARTCS